MHQPSILRTYIKSKKCNENRRQINKDLNHLTKQKCNTINLQQSNVDVKFPTKKYVIRSISVNNAVDVDKKLTDLKEEDVKSTYQLNSEQSNINMVKIKELPNKCLIKKQDINKVILNKKDRPNVVALKKNVIDGSLTNAVVLNSKALLKEKELLKPDKARIVETNLNSKELKNSINTSQSNDVKPAVKKYQSIFVNFPQNNVVDTNKKLTLNGIELKEVKIEDQSNNVQHKVNPIKVNELQTKKQHEGSLNNKEQSDNKEDKAQLLSKNKSSKVDKPRTRKKKLDLETMRTQQKEKWESELNNYLMKKKVCEEWSNEIITEPTCSKADNLNKKVQPIVEVVNKEILNKNEQPNVEVVKKDVNETSVNNKGQTNNKALINEIELPKLDNVETIDKNSDSIIESTENLDLTGCKENTNAEMQKPNQINKLNEICPKFHLNFIQKKSYVDNYNDFYKKVHKESSEEKTDNKTQEHLLKTLVDQFVLNVKEINNMNFEQIDIRLLQQGERSKTEKEEDFKYFMNDKIKYTYSLPIMYEENEEVSVENEYEDEDEDDEVFLSPNFIFKKGLEYYNLFDMINGMEKGPKLCEICGIILPKAGGYLIHIARHSGVDPFQCKMCGKRFATPNLLKVHFWTTYTKKEIYVCEHCDLPLHSDLSYKAHMEKHTTPSPNQCDICNVYFHNVKRLRHHSLHKHGVKQRKKKKPLPPCEHCGKKLPTFPSLERHRLSHEGRFAFTCDLCNKGFAEKFDLTHHIKTKHLNVKKYPCPDCNLKFATTTYAKIHYRRIHLDIKPFVCSICGARKVSERLLKIHMNLHAGHRPHVCKICNKNYAAPESLNRHMIVHDLSRAKLCSICGKRFAYVNSYKLHMRYHYGIKNYECNVCHRKFVRKFTLREHLKTHVQINRPGRKRKHTVEDLHV